MADVAVASTFVAAVLEHAGYLTQARFLQEFQSFFRDAGAFVYLLAGAGGVVSVAIYGSFRAAQYLLFGPALFWFLVGPTTETEGVLWKLGGGSYLGELRSQGEAESKEFRSKVLKKVEEQDSGGINVAVGFWLFARPASEFVNEFVDIMLKKENSEDLAANHKVGGLELIAKALPYESDQIQRLETFASKCSGMMSAGMAAGEAMMRGQLATDQGAAAPGSELEEIQKFHIDELKRRATDDHLETVSSGFDELIRAHGRQEGRPALEGSEGKESDLFSAKGSSKKALSLFVDGAPMTAITCGDAWHLLAEETWFSTERDSARIITLASGVWKYEEAVVEICKELTRKTLNGESEECNLKPAFALAMIHNHLTNMDTWGRVMSRHWNDRGEMNPKKSKLITGPMQQGFLPVQDPSTGSYKLDLIDGQVMMQVYKDAPAGTNGSEQATFSWAPIAPIVALHGRDHAMWVATREFETVKLRQTIYTYAMQMPYYQGLSLYFIAVLYPFMALIVLIPGRAVNFLNLPLSYLWVKSWDIGFAAVIILDKVMYNLLPNWEVHDELQTLESWVKPQTLARVFAQGYNFDPMGSLHIYYTVIAMVTMGIPVLTGAVILKTRRGVLSSFTDAISSQAKNRGNIAGNIFSIAQQNERNHMMMQVGGAARLSGISGQGGVEGGLKGKMANMYATIKAGNELWGNTQFSGLLSLNGGDLSKLPENLAKAAETHISQKSEMAQAEAKFESAMRMAYDPIMGRSGILQMYNEAYASSMDGGGGFELSMIGDNAVSELASLMGKKAVFAMKAQGELIENLVAKGSNALANTLVDKPNGLMETIITGSIAANIAQNNGLLDKDGNITVGVGALKEMFGAQAYTDEEFLARAFHIHRKTLEDPEMRAGLQKSFGSSFEGLFGVLINNPSPGGPSSAIDIYLSGAGGDRFLAAKPQWDAAVPEVVTPFTRVANPEDRPDWASLSGNVQAVYSWSADHMQYTQDLLSTKMQDDTVFRAKFPGANGLYQIEADQIRDRLITHFGGEAGIFKLWNGTVGQIEGFAPFATVEQARNISTSQLSHLALAADQTLGHSLEGKIAEDYAADSIEALILKKEIQLGQLPAGLAMIEQNNPRLAMQLVDDWMAQLRGGTPITSSIGFNNLEDGLATTPSSFFLKKK